MAGSSQLVHFRPAPRPRKRQRQLSHTSRAAGRHLHGTVRRRPCNGESRGEALVEHFRRVLPGAQPFRRCGKFSVTYAAVHGERLFRPLEPLAEAPVGREHLAERVLGGGDRLGAVLSDTARHVAHDAERAGAPCPRRGLAHQRSRAGDEGRRAHVRHQEAVGPLAAQRKAAVAASGHEDRDIAAFRLTKHERDVYSGKIEQNNKTVVDFGCEGGLEAIDMAQHGVQRVIGIDINTHGLAMATKRAKEAGVEDRCTFTTQTDEKADIVISLDAFEHFKDPLAILGVMRRIVKDDGYVLACFGPTWYHPLGGHGFSIFPWAHLVFTEGSFMRLYRESVNDPDYTNVRHFRDVRGGLSQLSINQFRKVVALSDFEFSTFETVPIRRIRILNNPLTREFTTSVVRCRLVPKRGR